MNRRSALRTVGLAGAAAVAACSPLLGADDIVDVTADTPELSILGLALAGAGLVGTLRQDGPFTLFAPSNAAFTAMPAAAYSALWKPANRDRLTALLRHHVVPGRIVSGDVTRRIGFATLDGGTLTLDSGDGFTVNGAAVTTANLGAANGVVHVIDRVLRP